MPLGDGAARCLPGLWLCSWFLSCGLPGGLPRLRRALPTGALLHGTLLKAAPPPPRAHVCFVSGLRLHSPLRSSLPEAVVQSTASRARSGRPGASLPPRHCGPRSAQARPCCHVPGEHRPDGNGLSLDATRCPPKSLASCLGAGRGRGQGKAPPFVRLAREIRLLFLCSCHDLGPRVAA